MFKCLNVKMLKCLLVLMLLCFNALVLTACTSAPTPLNYNQKNIRINDHVFTVEIADSAAKQTLGLSGRESLLLDHGMLFVFDSADIRSFWMKDMLFPIDILWLRDREIVAIDKNCPVPYNDKIPSFTPKIEVNNVLELNAGVADEFNIKIGDSVE